MPRISIFFGIVIYMYYDDHLPPHFHALYGGSEAVFDLEGNLIKGFVSSGAIKKYVIKLDRTFEIGGLLWTLFLI